MAAGRRAKSAVATSEHSEPTTTASSGPTNAATATDGSAYTTPDARAICHTPRRAEAIPGLGAPSAPVWAASTTMMKGTITKKGAS